MKKHACLDLRILSAMHISAGLFTDKCKCLLMSEPEKKKKKRVGAFVCVC